VEQGHDEFERLRPADGPPDPSGGRARGLTRGETRDSDAVPLHRRSAGEILDLGLEILKSRFAACVVISTLLWIPARILVQMTRVEGFQQNSTDPAKQMEIALASFGALGVSLVVMSVVQVLTSAFVAQFVKASFEGRAMSVGDALRRSLQRLPGILVISIVIGLASVAGLVLCCVPYIFVLWRLSLAVLVYVLEDVSIGESLRRAIGLTSGSFLRWLGVVVVGGLMVLPISGSAGLGDMQPVRLFVQEHLSMSRAAYEIVLVAITSVFLGLATAIQTAIMTVYYIDCRVRRDGVDLHAWLARARAAAPVRTSGETGA
jgi:hypothetical protein